MRQSQIFDYFSLDREHIVRASETRNFVNDVSIFRQPTLIEVYHRWQRNTSIIQHIQGHIKLISFPKH